MNVAAVGVKGVVALAVTAFFDAIGLGALDSSLCASLFEAFSVLFSVSLATLLGYKFDGVSRDDSRVELLRRRKSQREGLTLDFVLSVVAVVVGYSHTGIVVTFCVSLISVCIIWWAIALMRSQSEMERLDETIRKEKATKRNFS